MKSSRWLGKVLSKTRELCFHCLMENSVLYLVVPPSSNHLNVFLEPSLSTTSPQTGGSCYCATQPCAINAQGCCPCALTALVCLPKSRANLSVSSILQKLPRSRNGQSPHGPPGKGTGHPVLLQRCRLLSNIQSTSPQTLFNSPFPEGTSILISCCSHTFRSVHYLLLYSISQLCI